MNFSVLISCYFRDNPQELAVALKSIWDDQTLKPQEIVIVKDGPLTADLDAVIEEFAKNAPAKIVPLPQNGGLGKALQIGVENCSYEYIARMDGDDISVPDRFAKQAAFMTEHPEIDICGGMIEEFADDPMQPTGKRILPEKHEDIYKFLKTRSPFNHVTVFFRKEAIMRAGNYQSFISYEDYYLWARVLKQGSRGANLPDVLVNVRSGDLMIGRRRGWRIFKNEVALIWKFKELGVLNWYETLRNMLLRGTARLLPGFMLKMVYARLRK